MESTILFHKINNSSSFPSTSTPPYPEMEHPLKPTAFWGSLTSPYPTNEWWQNLVLKKGRDSIQTYPYSIKVRSKGVKISMPPLTLNRHYVAYWFSDGICLTASGVDRKGSLGSHYVVQYDDLSVTVEYQASTGTLQVPLVRGSPYITGIYSDLIPGFTSNVGIKSVNGSSVHGTVRGASFELLLWNDQTWIIYSDRVASFTWNNYTFWGVAENKLQSKTNWIVRVACLPPKDLNTNSDSAKILAKYASVYPTGGDANLVVESDGSKSSVTFSFKTATMSSGTDSSLLMLTLPHHRDVMLSLNTLSLSYNSIIGEMIAAEGNSWTYTEDLSNIPTWQATSSIPSDKKADIATQLKIDMKFTGLPTDTYSFGKGICRMARQALIADELGMTDVAGTIREMIKKGFKHWLNGTNSDPLRYDATWGGISPLKGINNKYRDFGAGYYNDHHFHYGYWLYAAAVVAKNDTVWAENTKEKFMALAADIASPKSGGIFPKLRHFDWYVGHSWASGLFSFADGPNQESVSECLNAWYGMYLYGMSIKESEVMLTGKALLGLELRAAHKYWHSSTEDSVYPDLFAKNKCIGMLWGDKCDQNTWFGSGLIYSHAINMIPFTPLSELLLNEEWVEEQYPVVETALSKRGYRDSWKGFIYMNHAVIAPDVAWEEIQGLESFDIGNSRVNAMWWIATRSQAGKKKLNR